MSRTVLVGLIPDADHLSIQETLRKSFALRRAAHRLIKQIKTSKEPLSAKNKSEKAKK